MYKDTKKLATQTFKIFHQKYLEIAKIDLRNYYALLYSECTKHN